MRTGRRRAVYGFAMVVTIAFGLLGRFAKIGLPPFAVKYIGSTMWALMIYWVLAALRPAWKLARLSVVAGAIATAVEFFKLYRSPRMDAFRMTLPGILLLGKYFSVWDLVAYALAIACGALLDWGVIRPRTAA
jgi:hypothetical protein